MTQGRGQPGFRGHWSSLPVKDACSRGNERRYCCDPDAWDHIETDFGKQGFCQGGFIDWFGEPLDDLLCRLAAEHGLDPHVVYDSGELNYKPYKTWWQEHVVSVVKALVNRQRDREVGRGETEDEPDERVGGTVGESQPESP